MHLQVFVTHTVGEFFRPTLGTDSMVDDTNLPHLVGNFAVQTGVHPPLFLKPSAYVTDTPASSVSWV